MGGYVSAHKLDSSGTAGVSLKRLEPPNCHDVKKPGRRLNLSAGFWINRSAAHEPVGLPGKAQRAGRITT
jgi:hypothetical protein